MNWGAISNDNSLTVYQQALRFVMALYGICTVLPVSEKKHLTPLFKKAGTGVTTHISESGKKQSGREKARSLNTALGYLEECGYYLDHAEKLGYVDTTAEKTQLKQVRDLLEDLISSLTDN